jgi:lipoyl(octanoyl) transferase
VPTATGTWCAAALPSRRMHKWHLWVDNAPRPGWANMAIDQTLLDRAEQSGESWLRLYQWAPHCLSFGRHEPAALRYDRERIEALRIDTVRRPTGGRAVWHAQELTYAVAAPSMEFGSLRSAYYEIHDMLAQALSMLGTPTYLAAPRRTPPLTAGACFAEAVGGEIMVGERKVVGSAQLRQKDALLQHGSILLEDNQITVADLMNGGPLPGEDVPRAAWAAPAEITEAVKTVAARRWHGDWLLVEEVPSVLSGAASYYPHYRSPSWTWAR